MHISKQRNGKWRVIVQDEGRRRSRVAATEREAKRAGARLMIELGKQPDPSQATVGDLIDLHLAQSDLADTTAMDREYLVAKTPDWLKDWRVENVTTMMVDQAYRRLLADGTLTAHRVVRLHNLLSPAFDRAARWGWINSNPIKSAAPPALPDTEMIVPTPAEVDAAVAAATASSVDFGCALYLVARTGIRRGELCGLQWQDLREDAGEIVVRRAISSTRGNGRKETKGKTGRAGHRVIPLGASAIRALKTHRVRQNTAALERGHPAPIWIFTHDGSRSWRADYVTAALARACDAADLERPIHIHQLRHFAATQWIAAGIDIRTVSYLLGHAKVSTTLDIYAHFLPARGRDAADVMERILESG